MICLIHADTTTKVDMSVSHAVGIKVEIEMPFDATWCCL